MQIKDWGEEDSAAAIMQLCKCALIGAASRRPVRGRFGARLLISGMIVSHWTSNARAPPRQTQVMTSLIRNDAR